MDSSKISKAVAQVGGLCTTLLSKHSIPFDSSKSFPTTGGVYLIYKNEEEIVYVGKARNLRRRICSNHLSAARSGKASAFRRSLHKKDKISFGPK